MQCSGITQKNKRCKRNTQGNCEFCHIHMERGEQTNEVELHQCPICFDMPQKQKLFDCNHGVCCECYVKLKRCPLCRYPKFGHSLRRVNLEYYRNILTENVLLMVRDYVAGFTSRVDLTNYVAKLLSNRFRTYDYLRGIYVLLVSGIDDEILTDKMIKVILYQT
jgi:hypothetical protein